MLIGKKINEKRWVGENFENGLKNCNSSKINKMNQRKKGKIKS